MQINLLTDFCVLYTLSAMQRDDCYVGCPPLSGYNPEMLTHPACGVVESRFHNFSHANKFAD